jgi:hypothetical protein
MCWIFKKKKRPSIEIVIHNKIHEESEEECAICLELLNDDLCMITKKCNHYFHYDCYNNYIRSCIQKKERVVECPLCRTTQGIL